MWIMSDPIWSKPSRQNEQRDADNQDRADHKLLSERQWRQISIDAIADECHAAQRIQHEARSGTVAK
jgi:hypothetical protein